MILAVIITELLITLKFDWETITKPLPPHVLLFWTVGASGKIFVLIEFFMIVLVYIFPSTRKETILIVSKNCDT